MVKYKKLIFAQEGNSIMDARRITIFDKPSVRIFILYLFKQLMTMTKSVEYSTASDLVMWEGTINYFDFTEEFAFLLENGALEEMQREDGTKGYALSKKGKMIIDNTEHDLVEEVKSRAMRSVMKYMLYERNGCRVESTIAEEGNGWRLNCSISNDERDLINVNLYSDDLTYLERLKFNFEQRETSVVKGIIALLTGDADYLLR